LVFFVFVLIHNGTFASLDILFCEISPHQKKKKKMECKYRWKIF